MSMPRIFTRERIKEVARTYMRMWHDMEVTGREHLLPHGPVLLLGNHASNLDVPAWLATDPYSDPRCDCGVTAP